MIPTKIQYPRFVLLSLVAIALTIGTALISGDRGLTAAAKDHVEQAKNDVQKNWINTIRQHPNGRVTQKELAYQIERERTPNTALAGNGAIQNARSGIGGIVDGVDPSFGARLEDGYTRVEVVSVQPDGKVVVAGVFPLVNGVRTPNVVRLNPDSSLDTTFNAGEVGANGAVNTLEILSDGRIIIGGTFTSYNGISRNRIARLNADGSLDTTFDVGVGPNNTGAGGNNMVLDLKVLPNGKYLVAGSFNQFNGIAAFRIVQLTDTGSVDSSFTAPTINSFVEKIAVQADGKVLIGGLFNQVGGISRNGVARLNSDGTHDTTFDPLNNATVSTYALAVQPDGKIVVGSAYTGAGSLVRLNADGSLDQSFTPPIAPGVETTVHSIIFLSGGKMLVGGFLNDGLDNGYGVVQLNADGSLDTNFNPQLSDAYFLEVFSMALTADGKIVCGGDFYHLGIATSKHVTRLRQDGDIDGAFTTNIEGFGVAFSTAQQPDGKLIVAGSFRSVNGTTRYNLVRLNSDGSIDPTFVGTTDTQVLTVALQPDGKVLIGGTFFTVNGAQQQSGARLTATGILDTTFNPPNDTNASVIYKVLVQPDGKIIAIGVIDTPRSPNGTTAVYRLNPDGSEDPAFTLTGFGGFVFEGALSSDGKIYIGGNFSNFGGSGFNRLARLNANGPVDTSFSIGTGANASVNAIAPQADGKVLVGGFFTSINGHFARGIARFISDGDQDPNFDPGLGLNGGLYDIYVQSDGKILIGGSFSTFNGMSRTNLARLDTDGSLDNLFTDQTNGVIRHINQQPDGKTIIGGGFTAINGAQSLGISRLSEAAVAPPANDNFAAAEIITGSSGTTSGNNTTATAEAGEPAHAGIPAAHSVWYRWTAPDTGLFSFTTSGSSFDTTLGVYIGSSVSSLTQIAASDDSASFDPTSLVVFHADAGTEYFIAVDGKNGSVGIVNLIYRQAARTYRFYAQTGNGFISPRIPTIIATRVPGGNQYTAVNLSPGVFELDLPVDNATYQVSITGTDIWSPNSFTIDNSRRPEVRNNATGETIHFEPDSGNLNLVVNAVTVAATVTGSLLGVTSPDGVNVFLGSEGGPNPIAPMPCAVTMSTTVNYECQFLVDTRHQIKPSLSAVVFSPVNVRFPPLNTNLDGVDFVAGAGQTYNISGQVTADGSPLLNATVSLTGHKINSYLTAEDGHFEFNNLPAGFSYTITAALDGYVFAPQTIDDLQSNQVVNMAAQGGCTYSVSTNQMGVSADGGEAHLTVNTANGCPWGATNTAPWITVTHGTGNGPGDMYFSVEPNHGMGRSTTMTVAGRQVTVEQANGCTYAFSGGSHSFPFTGGSSSIDVTASDAGCQWTPAATDYCMITGLTGGTGNQPLNFTVANNAGVARTAVIQLGTQAFAVDQAAAPGTHRARFDFDGDGRADVSVYRPSEGTWYLSNSTTGFLGRQFGVTEDIPVAADYDNDGKTDLAVFRPSTGYWYVLPSTTQEYVTYSFGLTGDVPVPADYDGDGRADLAVYRPSTGIWYLNLQSGVQAIPFGIPEDKPVVGDYDGDGRADIAVYRPSIGVWFMSRSTAGFNAVAFGLPTDVPVPADYDGDGITDVSVYRPSDTFWYRLNSSTGNFVYLQFGQTTDKPIPADYNGDTFADVAVYRPSTGYWYIWSCTGNVAITSTQFGLSTDVPIPYPIAP